MPQTPHWMTRGMSPNAKGKRREGAPSAPISVRVPERTCVGCRQTRPKGQFVRLACGPTGQLFLDHQGKLPGRGAYICPQRSCAEQASKGTRLREAFRHEVTPYPVDELVCAMASVMEDRALACIRIARKAGRVVSGYAQVSRALVSAPVACLLVAGDAACERLREYQGWCAQSQIPWRPFLTKTQLGELAGRDECSAIGILDARLAAHLIFYLEAMGRLMER
jgi:predicted RNA-binding protein YlxR (DUF448 family)